MTAGTPHAAEQPSLLDTVTLALVCALVAGILEPIAILSGISAVSEGRAMLGIYLLWMPAAANLALFAVLGLAGWGLSRLVPRRVTLEVLFGIYATLAFSAGFRILDGYLGILTVDLLALGLGVQVAQRLGPWFRPRLRATRMAVGLMLLVVAGLATGIEVREHRREQTALASMPAAGPGRPNILLLVLDTVRAMNLSVYGYARPTTPNLEALARRGTLFEHAATPAPWTRPSHASLFTGHWQHELSADHLVPLDDRYPTLAEQLDSLGYRTGGFAANITHVTAAAGMSRGFTHFEAHRITIPQLSMSASLTEAIYEFLQPKFHLPPVRVNYHRKTAADVNRALLAWVDRGGDRPFFAFANYMDAHVRYLPQPPFDTLFASPAYPPRLPARGTGPGMDRTQDMRPYDQAIAYLDHEIGALLAALDARGLLENTIVIVTADHGEAFGEHGIYGHGSTLYLQTVQVPLIVSWPKAVPTGRRVPQWISLRSVPATILELAEPGRPHPFPGPSLARYWLSDTATAGPVFSGSRYAANNPAWYPTSKGELDGVIEDDLLFIREADNHQELYHTIEDPVQRVNLIPSPVGDSAAARLGGVLERVVGPARLHPGYQPSP